jgi:hypothetical protein
MCELSELCELSPDGVESLCVEGVMGGLSFKDVGTGLPDLARVQPVRPVLKFAIFGSF